MTRLANPILGLVAACSSPQGLWRDQLVFVGDQGTVVPLGLVRQTPGSAEAKGWLGEGGTWRSVLYDRFAIRRKDAPDLGACIDAWSRAPERSAYVSLSRKNGGVDLSLRTRSARLSIRARTIRPLGTSKDPEGVSSWSAGRAVLGMGEHEASGWLLLEETPADRPRRPFVDFGDFALLFLAREDGDLAVLKRSRRRAGFDFAAARLDGRVVRTRGVSVEIESGRVRIAMPDHGWSALLEIRDRDVSQGVAPDGRKVTYETLLLGGDLAGVAFTIVAHRDASAANLPSGSAALRATSTDRSPGGQRRAPWRLARVEPEVEQEVAKTRSVGSSGRRDLPASCESIGASESPRRAGHRRLQVVGSRARAATFFVPPAPGPRTRPPREAD